jgi:tetratricopeptide (TPR) repeat protein
MILCQSCKAVNKPDLDYCDKCKTKLMLPVMGRGTDPQGLLNQSLEDHLLERISYLEYHLMRYHERYEKLLDLVQHQQAKVAASYVLMDALLDTLDAQGMVNKQALELNWNLRLRKHDQAKEVLLQLQDELRQILQVAPREVDPQFKQLVKQGFELLTNNETVAGMRVLEKAALFDQHNAPLNLFLGTYYWQQQKLRLADSYLSRALVQDRQNIRALILLGITRSDLGEYEAAKQYLFEADNILSEKDPQAFVLYLMMGQLFATGNEERALFYFRRALMRKPLAELNFIVGHIYLIRSNFKQALVYLNKAIDLDPQLDIAFYNLGLICWKNNMLPEAREYFQMAYNLNPNAHYREHYRKALRFRPGKELPYLPVFTGRIHRRPQWINEDGLLANLLQSYLSPPLLT